MRLNSQNKEDFERLNRPTGIAFALFEGTVKIMNPTLGLALGLALALLNTGCGITFPNSTAPVTEQPLIRIPDNLGPEIIGDPNQRLLRHGRGGVGKRNAAARI